MNALCIVTLKLRFSGRKRRKMDFSRRNTFELRSEAVIRHYCMLQGSYLRQSHDVGTLAWHKDMSHTSV